jgi:hypothetical protein
MLSPAGVGSACGCAASASEAGAAPAAVRMQRVECRGRLYSALHERISGTLFPPPPFGDVGPALLVSASEKGALLEMA